jgi:hypothetical protein
MEAAAAKDVLIMIPSLNSVHVAGGRTRKRERDEYPRRRRDSDNVVLKIVQAYAYFP